MESTKQKQRAYLDQRLQELGITDELNKVRLFNAYSQTNKPYEQKVFDYTAEGDIKIAVWNLDRYMIEYDDPTLEKANSINATYSDTKRNFYLIRYSPENIQRQIEQYEAQGKHDEEPPKYKNPKGVGVLPFFHENIIKSFENKETIISLVLTEGYFKAFKANMCNIPVVGLNGIMGLTDKEKFFHKDIVRIISECKVKNVIMLYDGDCLNISEKALRKGNDLTKRPLGFFNSIQKVVDLCKDFEVNVFFAHVNSENIEGNPKGLDDLLIQQQGHEQEIRDELLHVGGGTANYFIKKEVTKNKNLKKLKDYFHLTNEHIFYKAWEHIIGDKEFVFFGNTYKNTLDEQTQTYSVELIESKDLKAFIRVGNDYYKKIQRPILGTDDTETVLVQRTRTTITDDFGKAALKRIVKYEAFINYPDNITWQQSIKNCYNLYIEVNHDTHPGSWRNTEMFLRHIFGEQYELGLDYIKLLYEQPCQPLPVLCLVSKERKTGKSTFLNFLKMIFRGNVIICGNSDIQSEFNSFICTKLIVAVDETSLADNQKITEKIKMLSTAKKVISNAKGKNQIEIDHFAKYILCSNEETRFIYTQEEETRFWVRKVCPFKEENTRLLFLMNDELPAFLDFLRQRPLSVPNESRTYFKESLLQTEALKRLKDEQRSTPEKLIRNFVTEYFEDFEDASYLMIDKQRMIEHIEGLGKWANIIDNICRDNLKVEKYIGIDGKSKSKRFYFYRPVSDPLSSDYVTRETLSYVGRPYVFYRKDFIKE